MANFNTNQIGLYYPKTRETYVKFVKVTRSDTTAAIRAALPKTALVVGLYVIGTVASDAATTATISVGTTSSANELINAYDVKTAATATGYNAAGSKAVGTAMATPFASDLPIYVKYAETGTASTTGGPWYVKIEFVVPGAQEGIDD